MVPWGDQNTGPFSKKKIKEVFSAIDPKQGYLGSVFLQESVLGQKLYSQRLCMRDDVDIFMRLKLE